MTIIPGWLLAQFQGVAVGYAALASGAVDWWIRKLKAALMKYR